MERVILDLHNDPFLEIYESGPAHALGEITIVFNECFLGVNSDLVSRIKRRFIFSNLAKKYARRFVYFSGLFPVEQYNRQTYADYADIYKRAVLGNSKIDDGWFILIGHSTSAFHVLDIHDESIVGKILINPAIRVNDDLSHLKDFRLEARLHPFPILIASSIRHHEFYGPASDYHTGLKEMKRDIKFLELGAGHMKYDLPEIIETFDQTWPLDTLVSYLSNCRHTP